MENKKWNLIRVLTGFGTVALLLLLLETILRSVDTGIACNRTTSVLGVAEVYLDIIIVSVIIGLNVLVLIKMWCKSCRRKMYGCYDIRKKKRR